MVRLGRCDEARRVVRITAEYFPDVKARFDDIPTGCRPARDDKTDRTEVATIDKRSDDRGDTTPLAAGSAAAPQRAPEPTPVAAQIKPPDAARPAATGPSAPGLAPAAAPVAPPPIPAASVRKVPPAELEGLRVAGVRTPPLPGNIKQIARRDGVKRILLAAEVCVGTDGHVTSARLVKASEYDEANESVLSAIRDWRFRPYLVEGVPSPICSGVVLPYAVEG
jgi:protein TonB